MVLEKINQVGDIKQIPPEEYDTLAEEIRHFLVEKISRSGGHLASNLGVVELTMALHLCFDFPKDKVVWGGTSVLYAQAADRKKVRI